MQPGVSNAPVDPKAALDAQNAKKQQQQAGLGGTPTPGGGTNPFVGTPMSSAASTDQPAGIGSSSPDEGVVPPGQATTGKMPDWWTPGFDPSTGQNPPTLWSSSPNEGVVPDHPNEPPPGQPGPGGHPTGPDAFPPTGTPPPTTLPDITQDPLYQTLLHRAAQNIVPDPNDPALKAQTDAYNANTDRATTQYLQKVAEQGGQFGNMAAETRSAKETAGQAEGTFAAQTTLNEITARRQEVQNALQGAVGMQALKLQQELAQLDNAYKYYSSGLQNTQFNKQLAQNQNQFLLGQQLTREQMQQAETQFRDSLSEQDKQFYDNLSENDKQFMATQQLTREQMAQAEGQFRSSLNEQDKQFYDSLSEQDKQFYASLAQRAYEFDQNYNLGLLNG